MAETEVTNTLPRDFSKVILSLQNVLLPDEKLSPTPSLTDGLDSDTEWDLRILGCELIQTSGILLKLPQVAMATGQALFQRFYYSKSFVKHNMEILAMACVNLAAKIEEGPRRIRDVINVFHHIKQVKNAKTISPLILDQNYINLKNNVIKSERRVLKELGFCVHVQHPHKMIVMFLQVLECQDNPRLVQCAWNYMNDSFRTMAFLKYQPETVACACIFLAARKLQIPLPNNPHWFLLFNVTEEDITDVCLQVLRLYVRQKADVDLLEKKVNEAKKIHMEAKRKIKGLASESATPNSRAVSPSKESPSSLHVPAIKKLVSEDDHSDGSFGRDLDQGTRRKRAHSRSPSVSKSRSYSSSRSRSGSADGDFRRYPSKKHKHNTHHSKDRYNSSNSIPTSDKYTKDRYPSDKNYDKHIDKYSDKYTNDRYIEKDRYSSSNKYDPKYDAYNYRDYKEKDKSRDYKRPSGKHRDSSYSPALERSPLHKKSYHRDRHHSRSRSPVDRHRSKKHASNGRNSRNDRYSRR